MLAMLASVLALLLVIVPVVPSDPPPILGETAGIRPLSSLALRLQQERSAVTRDEAGQTVAIFGLPAAEARMLLLPVDRQRALPDGYRPPDLTWVGGRMVRGIAKSDVLAMIDAADSEGIEIVPISGYRAPDEQALAFESAVWGAMARSGDGIDRTEAENRMARFVAPPGHSQHQL